MKKLAALVGFVAVLAFPVLSHAGKFKGYSRQPSAETMTFNERIDRIAETKSEFLVLFEHHPAFYSFPKREGQGSEVKFYLETRVKDKKPVTAQIDPVSAQIILLQDSVAQSGH